MGSEANDVCGVPRGLAACANSIVSVLPTLQLPDDKTLLTKVQLLQSTTCLVIILKALALPIAAVERIMKPYLGSAFGVGGSISGEETFLIYNDSIKLKLESPV